MGSSETDALVIRLGRHWYGCYPFTWSVIYEGEVIGGYHTRTEYLHPRVAEARELLQELYIRINATMAPPGIEGSDIPAFMYAMATTAASITAMAAVAKTWLDGRAGATKARIQGRNSRKFLVYDHDGLVVLDVQGDLSVDEIEQILRARGAPHRIHGVEDSDESSTE